MKSAHPDDVFDLGLQQERTALAWDRTGLAMMAGGAVLLRAHGETFVFVFSLLGGGIIVDGAWLVFFAGLRYRRLHGLLREAGDVTSPRLTRVVAISTIVFAIAVIARAIFP